MARGWNHTATIDPALWIKALIEAEPDHASDMMDELNFGPNVKDGPQARRSTPDKSSQ